MKQKKQQLTRVFFPRDFWYSVYHINYKFNHSYEYLAAQH